MQALRNRILIALFLTGFIGCLGCINQSQNQVRVYAALDKEFSEPILKAFSEKTGIQVLSKFDVESNKTVGLANEIIAQKDRQRCDVFWNNEILHSLRLKKEGLLEVYEPPILNRIPKSFVSKDRDWFGFAARARVLIVNTDLIPVEADRPRSVMDLIDPKWKGQCTIARPLFGTTATHAAVLFSAWGEKEAESFFKTVANNAVVQSGNKQVALKVASGEMAWGITDTDDAIIEVEKGAPVTLVFPDQAAGQTGTLLIPNTLCILKQSPFVKQSRQLVDYLLTAEVETQLAKGASAQIPLIKTVAKTKAFNSRVVPTGQELKIMAVDFQDAADRWESVAAFLNETFPLAQ